MPQQNFEIARPVHYCTEHWYKLVYSRIDMLQNQVVNHHRRYFCSSGVIRWTQFRKSTQLQIQQAQGSCGPKIKWFKTRVTFREYSMQHNWFVTSLRNFTLCARMFQSWISQVQFLAFQILNEYHPLVVVVCVLDSCECLWNEPCAAIDDSIIS